MQQINDQLLTNLNQIYYLDACLNERWKPIAEYDNYSISSFGRVKNNVTGRILKPIIDTRGYYKTNIPNGLKPKIVYFHRLVAGHFLENPLMTRCVDHIDRNPLNNHLSNLRYATHAENSHNSKMRSSNTSGYKGIQWKEKLQKWRVEVSAPGYKKHIGMFVSLEDAIIARNEAFTERHGEFMNI